MLHHKLQWVRIFIVLILYNEQSKKNETKIKMNLITWSQSDDKFKLSGCDQNTKIFIRTTYNTGYIIGIILFQKQISRTPSSVYNTDRIKKFTEVETAKKEKNSIIR